jgi:hypothetical protein
MSKRSKGPKATNVFADTTTQTQEAPAAEVTTAPAVTDDVPPGAEAAAVPAVTEKPKMTEAEKKAHRSQKRKERRIKKMRDAGKVPLAERARTPNGALVPKEGGARLFCYNVQVANNFPAPTQLSALMQAAAVGTAFEGRPKRWFARRAWRNHRLYTAATTAAEVVSSAE